MVHAHKLSRDVFTRMPATTAKWGKLVIDKKYFQNLFQKKGVHKTFEHALTKNIRYELMGANNGLIFIGNCGAISTVR